MSRVLLFGKMPAHGDFVARGLESGERGALDAWLSASLAAARATPAFDDLYDRAPPWRCRTVAGAGAIAPSQDRVGRRFPLLLAVRGGDEDTAAACEALLYDAIAGGWDADALVAAAPEGSADTPVEPDRWWTLGGDGFPPASRPGARPDDLVTAMIRAGDSD